MINVISAVFRGAQSTTTRNAYQYDYGQVLKTNLALPETYEVQFSNNSSGGVAITQIGNADGVTIPDQMFISGAPIYAWIFLHQGADDGETVYFITIPVTKRAKPTSKQPTPAQKDAITQAIAALNAAVEQTGQDVEDANNAAESARESADAFEGMIAEEYDENKTYTIGDYSIHNDVLYRCTTAITTAEAWTAAHWTAAVLGDDVSNLKSAITSLDSEYHSHIVDCINLFNPNDPDLILNYKLNNNGTTEATTGKFVSGYVPVVPGKAYCFHYPTGTYGSASSVVTYNANKERISYSQPTRATDANGHGYLKYTAGTGVYFVRMTGHMADMGYYMYVQAETMPSTYIPYTTNKTLEDTYVDFSMVKNIEISKEDTDFITDQSVNLVDLSALVPGILTNSNSNGNIDTSGSYGTNWVTTDYIPVEPGETYALCIFPGANYGASYAGVPYYDENKNFLGRVKQAGGSVAAVASRVTITLPNQPNIKYIRTSYYKSYTDSTGADHKRWWQTQIFKASAWPTDMYVPFDGSDKIVETRLDDVYSAKYNPLWGKTAMWNGDSICAADSDTGAGWPGRIASANGMKYKNYGISGGTIAENTGSGVHSVSATLDEMLTDFPNADYIIIEGGTNDADILGSEGIGTFDADDFSAEYIAALDKDTFSGALESIFYRLVTQMKGKHIGYLIPQKMGHTEVLVTRRRAYFDRAILICKKWGIPYLDLWNGLYFNWRLAAHWDQTMTGAENEAAGNLYLDGQHLTTTGYAVESPIIAEWMKTI